MNKILPLIIFLIFSISLNAQQIPKDKQLHFTAGAVIGGWGTLTVSQETLWKPAIAGVLWATVAGAGKESYDKMTGGKFDVKDLGATVIGSIVSVGIITGIKAIKKHKRHIK